MVPNVAVNSIFACLSLWRLLRCQSQWHTTHTPTHAAMHVALPPSYCVYLARRLPVNHTRVSSSRHKIKWRNGYLLEHVCYWVACSPKKRKIVKTRVNVLFRPPPPSSPQSMYTDSEEYVEGAPGCP